MMNGKRVIKLSIGLLFLVLIGWTVIKAVSKEAKEPIKYISAIPDIELTDIYYSAVSLASLASDANHYVLVFFSPGCMFCEHEAADLSRNRAEFKDSKVLFITQEPLDSALAYSTRHNLMTANNFHVLSDTTYAVLPRFGIQSMPTTLIYNSRKEFVTSFEGEVNAKRILRVLIGE